MHHYKLKLVAEDIDERTLTGDLVGCFCDYLATKARLYCADPPSPLLAWSTIQGYFSSFKTHFIDKFRTVPDALLDQLTKRYVSSMLQLKTEIVLRQGETLYSKKESASEEDIKAFTAICFWNDDVRSAEYLHLVRSSINNCGRGSEIAILKWSKLHAIVIKQGGKSFKTMMTSVNRLKTQHIHVGDDHITHMVHVNDFMKDYMFIMFYSLVMSKSIGDESEHMFPSWYKSVTNTKTGGIDSQVSNLFKEHWTRIMLIGKEYVSNSELHNSIDIVQEYNIDEMSAKKKPAGAHDAKILSIQILGNSDLAPQHIIPRAGWLMKAFHTFFDYWNGTSESMKKSALAMGEWPNCGSSGIKATSGASPDFSSIKNDEVLVKSFVKHLIGDVQGLNEEVKSILVANGLRHMDAFQDFMKLEPTGKFQDNASESSTSLFNVSIDRALVAAHVTQVKFQHWKDNVKEDFWLKNVWSVPEFRQKFGARPLNLFPPEFTFSDYFLHSEQRSQVVHNQNLALRKDVNDLKNQCDKMTSMIAEIHKNICVDQKQSARPQEIDVLEESIPKNLHLPFKKVIKMMRDANSIDDSIFIAVYYRFKETFELLTVEEKKKEKTSLCKWMKCVDVVMSQGVLPKFSDEEQPNLGSLKVEIKRIVNIIARECKSAHILGNNKTLTMTFLSSNNAALKTILVEMKK
jgi:hypothetical protein